MRGLTSLCLPAVKNTAANTAVKRSVKHMSRKFLVEAFPEVLYAQLLCYLQREPSHYAVIMVGHPTTLILPGFRIGYRKIERRYPRLQSWYLSNFRVSGTLAICRFSLVVEFVRKKGNLFARRITD